MLSETKLFHQQRGPHRASTYTSLTMLVLRSCDFGVGAAKVHVVFYARAEKLRLAMFCANVLVLVEVATLELELAKRSLCATTLML